MLVIFADIMTCCCFFIHAHTYRSAFLLVLASAVFLALFTPAAGQQQSPAAHFVQLYVYPALFGSIGGGFAGAGSGQRAANDFGLAEWWSQLFAGDDDDATANAALAPLTVPMQQAAEIVMFVSMTAAVLVDMGLWRRLVPARSGPASSAAKPNSDKKRQ